MPVGEGKTTPERVRESCAWVAERARHVRVVGSAIGQYAAELAEVVETAAPEWPSDPAAGLPESDRELRAAFVLCLDAINFGSGWWPTIRKRAGSSGYTTISSALLERFLADGAWTAARLAEIAPAEVAGAVGQTPRHPLMKHYANALRDVGAAVARGYNGSFAAVADSAGGSAAALVDLLAAWPSFADESRYAGRRIAFFKRAQIAAADLHGAGVAQLRGLDRLTAFADNLVPHVLRLDGILALAEDLEAAIDGGRLLAHGSPPEVELRACCVDAVERLAGAAALPPAHVDSLLWHRGQGASYKARPRPRSRTTAY